MADNPYYEDIPDGEEGDMLLKLVALKTIRDDIQPTIH